MKFDPTRKRATVVVREKNQSNIKVLTKGADSVLSKKLAPGQEEMMAVTQEYLEKNANEGLRTLLICERTMTTEEYDTWLQKYQQARANPDE